ncbi:MAG: HAD hydrolase family protein [Bacteroidota bacterium]
MNNLEKFRKIKAFIFDVDGVLADHSVFVFTNGQIVRQLHQKDLVALEKAVSQKFIVAVITGGSLGGLLTTFQELGIRDIYEKKRDKKAAYDDFKLTYDLDDEQILYMGDDLPDYAVMRIVGLPTCPQNAAPEIKEISVYSSPYKGGQGCVRDVVEKVMKLKKAWHP